MQHLFFEAIRYFTGDTFVLEGNVIISLKKVDDGLVFHQVFTEKFWEKLRQVLILAHWQKESEKTIYADARAKAIMEKLKKNKEEVQRLKSKKGDSESLEVLR